MRCDTTCRARLIAIVRIASLSAVLLGATSVLWLAPASAQAPRSPSLLLDRPYAFERAVIEEGVTRAQAVTPDFATLGELRGRLNADRSSTIEVTFPLFDNATMTLVFNRIEDVGNGATAFHGSVAGVPLSSAVLVEREGIVIGNVQAEGRSYQIRFRATGHELREIDPSVFRDHDREPLSPPRSPLPIGRSGDSSRAVGATKVTQVDDGSLIDVMVAYTATTRAASGGTPSILAEIALGVTETNGAYVSSGVIQRIRLVRAMEVAYAESGSLSTDIGRLQTKNDAFLDEVHAARDLYGADVVSLWVENSGSSCGTGYLQDPVSAFFEAFAFNVVRRGCATGNYSFGHELGHNMGLRHDVFVDQVTTPFAYGHGYVDITNRFRTIMAYADACDAATPAVFCTRIQYFSNPAVNYMGFTTGNAATANEKLALDNTRITVANYRASVATSAAPPAITSPNAVQFFVGIPGTFSLKTTGAPAPTLASAGALPGAVSFTAGTGVLAGTPVLANIGVYPLTFTASNGSLPNATQNFTLTISPTPLCVLDLDGNGTLDALTDGLMLVRAIFGLSGDSVTAGAIGANATRSTWAQISPLILQPALDLDGNGVTDALTDGLMLLRAMFGLTGTSVTNGAVASSPLPTRATWPLIRAYVNTTCGSSFSP